METGEILPNLSPNPELQRMTESEKDEILTGFAEKVNLGALGGPTEFGGNEDYAKNSWGIGVRTPIPELQTPSIWTDVDGLIRGTDDDLKQYNTIHDKHYRMTLEHIYSLMKPAEILPYEPGESCLIKKEKYIELLNKNKEGEKNV